MMKKIFFVLFYSLMSVMLYGQGFAVSTDKMNVAYVGIDNPLTIVAEGYNCSQLIATCDNDTLKKGEGCQYIFHPENIGLYDILISAKTKSGIRKIGVNKIKVKFKTTARVTIAGKSEGEISADLFMRQPGPEIMFDDHDDEIRAIIKSFRIVFLLERNNAIAVEIAGSKFNNNTLEIIRKLKPGDKVFIENIKVAYGGRIVPFNSVTFTID